MIEGLFLSGINNRVEQGKEDGDQAYFYALSLKLEYLTKIVTSGVVACIGDDVDRHRYSLEHKLIRADSMGGWTGALNKILVGPPAQFINPNARDLIRDLTGLVGLGDWRYSAVTDIDQAAKAIGADTPRLGDRVALRQFFDIGTTLRNRSRGHGAPTTAQCNKSCVLLVRCLDAIAQNLEFFKKLWAYLHRNLSGKYRISLLLGDSSQFDYLKKTREDSFQNGVYLYLGRPVRVPLIFSDPDVLDIAVPNGNYRGDKFKILSYSTNEERPIDGSAWSDPPTRLPKSETEGQSNMEPLGESTFANIPLELVDYVARKDLENHLKEELLKTERHPIISLTGPGGIGKTTITIATIQKIVKDGSSPYRVVLWISARDIDLLESGPKPVTPRVITQQDISRAAVELLEASGSSKTSDCDSLFQGYLENGTVGTTLFVLDNFETVQNPTDVFRWIDTYIRPPNKVLITTRFRSFRGDYPIEIGGMTEEEAHHLVDGHAAQLSIAALLSPNYKNELIRETDGHPYVMKILLGQVAKERRAVKPERIVASSDDLLKALFERTYNMLKPDSQRVFLLLCSWRGVSVPEVAVEAVSLRPGTERFDVAGSLEELQRFSLINRIVSNEENEGHVGVPLAASVYGRRKLEVSPFKIAVEEDRKLLMEFGAGQRSGVKQGVFPRIEKFVRTAAERMSTGSASLEEVLPVLEYLAARVPKTYLRLADLVLEADGAMDRAKNYVRNFLENAPLPDRQEAWLRLVDFCQSDGDVIGEIHALSDAALLPASDHEDLSRFANRLNNRIRDLKNNVNRDAWSSEVQELLEKVIGAMERHLSKLSATDCSRLAWLYLNIGNSQRAMDIAQVGGKRDPANEHCQNLIHRLQDE